MSKIEIFFSEDSERSEFEAICKGYRTDVYVRVENRIYQLSIFTLGRLQSEFESVVEREGYYDIEPNIVLVTETNKAEILHTINCLHKDSYFDKIKETEYKQINEIIGIYGTKLNLVQVQ